MRIFILVLITLLFSAPTMADSPEMTAVTRSVVRVVAFSSLEGERKMIGHGTGIVVAPGKIITNAHVVEEGVFNEAITFQIIPSSGGETYMATIIKWSPENDLALLQLENGARLTPAKFHSDTVDNGGDIFAIGYPGSVDIAMELNEDDILRPQPPVRTRGTISAGRSSKSYDTVLHTAPIGPGNSGGPIVDHCGRVVGVNSFGSTNENGGSEFYFAITIREVAAFLKAQNVGFNLGNGPCQTFAEMNAAEKTKEAQNRAKVEAEQRIAAELAAAKAGKIRRNAELAIISEREDRMAISGVLLLFALTGAFSAFLLTERKKIPFAALSGGLSVLMIFSAIWVFKGRPDFDDIDAMVRVQINKDSIVEAAKQNLQTEQAKAAQ
jgi:serine protease Do